MNKHCNFLLHCEIYFHALFQSFNLVSLAAPIDEMEKHCNIEIAAQISRISSSQNGTEKSLGVQIISTFVYTIFPKPFLVCEQTLKFVVDGERDRYQLEGLMESPSVADDGDCFSPLLLNATSVNIEVYYNKAVNYTLMVTFVSFFYTCHVNL